MSGGNSATAHTTQLSTYIISKLCSLFLSFPISSTSFPLDFFKMPPINHPALATAGIIVVSAITAAAIAVYQHPEVREWTQRTRREIAVALRNLSEDINPNRQDRSQEPRYNRPEDAEGFMQSGGAGLDGDEESKRRQREELMYWNRIHLEKMESERGESNRSRNSTFDDFLHEDKTAEKGTFVYNSGAEIYNNANEGLIHRRGDNARGMATGALFANPFADENHIDMEQEETVQAIMAPTPTGRSETTDIYTADDLKYSRESTATMFKDDSDNESEQLIDVSDPATPTSEASEAEAYQSYMSAGEEAHPESVFASIHAWADNSNQSFYSPLPGTPQQAPSVSTTPSEFELTDGQLTPTDSVSLAGSGEDVGVMSEAGSHHYDVMSEDGDGIVTPSSWTEVGSTVSESDGSQH